ncbi:DUF2585 domain-containing protein [Salinarimonas soli]|uniref:UPF0314 protein F0L46_14580 n=1 Tax=Salinarimonas soli TaxID=1638099 RepID=A0A5B2VCB5_9HYPH|nr:DUF2585 domain-containing protein [Salinarimonas soli]KAA2236365.1 DUF2585 domain-containing protein [Salinarimonas soli]
MQASETAPRQADLPAPARLGWTVAAFGVVLATALILLAMGREPICKCGVVKLWHGVVQSSENSQHLTDWYTPSHVIHGFLFYGAVWGLGRLAGRRIPFGWGLVMALVVEGAWEITENTDAVIGRYREATIALDYFGDSVLNSVSDMAAMTAGFLLAARLPVAVTVGLALAMEVFVGWTVRDGLALNVLMLLWPLDAVRTWQGGGG